MRFVCDKAQAVQAIKDCKKVVRGKAPSLALECVRIYANGSVRFIGTDLDTFIEAGVTTAGRATKGCAVVPLKMVEKVVSKMAGDIVFTGKGIDLVVEAKGGKKSFTVKGIAPDAFPETPKVNTYSYKVPGSVLLDGFEKTIFAVSDDDAQYYLTGVCMKQEGDKLTMVATDGKRLSKVTHPTTAFPGGTEIIVGTKGVSAVLSVFNDKEAVKVTVSKAPENKEDRRRVVVFTQGKKRVAVNTIDGQFPAYDQVFPKKYDGSMSADVEKLIEGIDTVSIMAGDYRETFTITKKAVEIGASSDEGDAKIEVACSWSGKRAARAGFNYHYLLDYLKLCKHLKVERAAVDLIVPDDGNVVSPALWRQGGWEYLLMPMKLKV
jgi:DNA polymerase-3 subunit beta